MSAYPTWAQEGTRLTCRCAYGDYFAEMPESWELARIHPSALAVCEWFLFDRIDAAIDGRAPSPPPTLPARPRGKRVALSYSGGLDSTAALAVIHAADPIPIYLERGYRSYRLRGSEIPLRDPGPEHELAAARGALIIPNNLETIRSDAGIGHGFAHGCGYAAIVCLLADHLGLGTLAFGVPLEVSLMSDGYRFVGVTPQHEQTCHALTLAGLTLCYPVGGCSEALNYEICNRAGLSALSCPLADREGRPCGTCFKCFRKLRLGGRSGPAPRPSVLRTLAARPLKEATSVLYAASKSGDWPQEIEEYRGFDLSFLERYYDSAVDAFAPPELRPVIRTSLERLGFSPMTPEEEERLRTIQDVFDPRFA
jgi:hypothetical protein